MQTTFVEIAGLRVTACLIACIYNTKRVIYDVTAYYSLDCCTDLVDIRETLVSYVGQ